MTFINPIAILLKGVIILSKTTIYLIRHGESQGNAVRKFLGHTNLDLTQKGHMQAQEKVAEYYEKGHGTEKDDETAYKWYKSAAKQGSKLGKAKAKEFELFNFYK